ERGERAQVADSQRLPETVQRFLQHGRALRAPPRGPVDLREIGFHDREVSRIRRALLLPDGNDILEEPLGGLEVALGAGGAPATVHSPRGFLLSRPPSGRKQEQRNSTHPRLSFAPQNLWRSYPWRRRKAVSVCRVEVKRGTIYHDTTQVDQPLHI